MTGYDRHLTILAALAVAAGIFIRFWDLGGAPLAVDEYYFGTSMLNIVERGLPQFACGGFYTRGLLIQYMTIPLIESGVSLEFAVRFWPAIASVLTIVGVWRISQLAGGPLLASIAVILTSLSLWEIEFARFGRMYAPFQAVFVWYAYFQIQHLVNGKDGARWWYLGLSAVSIFVYAGASFLLILNFLPLVWRGRKWTVVHVVIAAALMLVGVEFYSEDSRYSGVATDALPPAIGSESGLALPINIPVLPNALAPILVSGLLIAGLAMWRFRQQLFFRHPATLFWVLATLCLSFGLIGFGVGLLVAGVLLSLPLPAWEHGLLSRPRAAHLLLPLIVWAAILLVGFIFSGADVLTSVKYSLRYLFDYPDLYYLVVRPWLQAIPITTVAMFVLTLPVLWTAFRSLRNEDSTDTSVLRYLLGTLILLLLLAAIFRQPFAITRYTYFLYPLIIIVSSAGIVAVTIRLLPRVRNLLFVPFVLIGILFVVAEDYSVRHLANINEPQFRYRTAYDAHRASHYYLRWDYRGVAEYVNSNLRQEDSVIVFDHPLPHYLDRTDGAFVREGTKRHTLIWACNGTRHLWSNAPLLDREVEVQRLIDDTDGQVWIITRTAGIAWLDPLESSLVRRYSLEPQFTSQDGHLVVYRIADPQAAPP